MQNYKELIVWKKAHQITLKVYKVTAVFPKEELYGLTNQLRRATSSIPANIAEGCGRSSQKDFSYFLSVSLGSANEAEYFLLLANDLGYLSQKTFTELLDEINQVKAMLIALISKVKPPLAPDL